MEEQIGTLVTCVLIFFAALAVHGFCVLGKFAFVQLRKESIEERVRDGDMSARKLLRYYDAPGIFLSMAQAGVSLSAFTAGATLFYGLVYTYGEWGVLTPFYILHVLIYGAVIAVLTLLFWVLGELVPKSVGMQVPEKTLRVVGGAIYGMSKIFYPLLAAGMKLGQLVLSGKSLDVTNEIDMVHSEDEIRMLITASHKEGKIDKLESELIDNVFDFSDLLAKEIMIPRQEIVCLYAEESMAQNLKTINTSRHTRYPLCEEDKDHVLGLVHIKDVLDLHINRRNNLRLINRPILMVPEIMPVSKLLQLMRARRTYLAVVVDEYGSTVGLIGLEDIMEELVGTIRNEHTAEKEEIQPLPQGAYEFAGTVLLDDVEELLHIPVEDDLDVDTIGGYVFNLLGHTPHVKDKVTIGRYVFTVMEIQGFRIVRLRAVPGIVPEEPGDTHESE